MGFLLASFCVTAIIVMSLTDGNGSGFCIGTEVKNHTTSVEAEPQKVVKEPIEPFDTEKPCQCCSADDGYIDAHSNCQAIGNIYQKIDYDLQLETSSPIVDSRLTPMAVQSACLRCGICLSVAEKLHTSLSESQLNATSPPETESEENFWSFRLSGKDEMGQDNISTVLREACCHGFSNYGLREYAGERKVSEALSHTSYVPTILDGQWTEKLREVCHFYVNEYGYMKLYRDWLRGTQQFPSEDLASLLCRNDGVFRECLNMNVTIKETEDDQFEAGNTVYILPCLHK